MLLRIVLLAASNEYCCQADYCGTANHRCCGLHTIQNSQYSCSNGDCSYNHKPKTSTFDLSSICSQTISGMTSGVFSLLIIYFMHGAIEIRTDFLKVGLHGFSITLIGMNLLQTLIKIPLRWSEIQNTSYPSKEIFKLLSHVPNVYSYVWSYMVLLRAEYNVSRVCHVQ